MSPSTHLPRRFNRAVARQDSFATAARGQSQLFAMNQTQQKTLNSSVFRAKQSERGGIEPVVRFALYAILPFGLPFSLENETDLTRLLTAWPTLPDHLRLTFLTLIDSLGASPLG